MTMDEAVAQACSAVGVVVPAGRLAMNKWILADTLDKRGKGDGRVICDEHRVTCVNWQTGDKATVWLKENRTREDRRDFAALRLKQRAEDRDRAHRAAQIAGRIVAASELTTHPYLAGKGFPDEQALTAPAELIGRIGGDYLVPEGGKRALVVPARIGNRLVSVQLIWTGGTKKFLYGGDMGGAAHRISMGADSWLCEGYATALSLRQALRGLNRRDTVLVCFSASNLVKVAASIKGPRMIAADHDAPPAAKPEQFDGLGAGEYYARKSGAPYLMPPEERMDINDLHQKSGIFAVQRLITAMARGFRP